MSATRRPKPLTPRLLTKAGGLLLRRKHFQERVFVYVHLVLVPFRIDERIRAFADSGVLRLHVVHGWMGAQRDIAWQGPQQLEATLILAGHAGDLGVVY